MANAALKETCAATGARLSSSEINVLVHVADGLTYDEAGEKMSLSSHTVRSHMQHAMAKIGARSRTHACCEAIRQGLIQ